MNGNIWNVIKKAVVEDELRGFDIAGIEKIIGENFPGVVVHLVAGEIKK